MAGGLTGGGVADRLSALSKTPAAESALESEELGELRDELAAATEARLKAELSEVRKDTGHTRTAS